MPYYSKLFHHGTPHFVYISNPMRSHEMDHVRWCFAPSGSITLCIVGVEVNCRPTPSLPECIRLEYASKPGSWLRAPVEDDLLIRRFEGTHSRDNGRAVWEEWLRGLDFGKGDCRTKAWFKGRRSRWAFSYVSMLPALWTNYVMKCKWKCKVANKLCN